MVSKKLRNIKRFQKDKIYITDEYVETLFCMKTVEILPLMFQKDLNTLGFEKKFAP